MTQKIDVTVAAIIKAEERFLLVEENAGGEIVFNQPAGHLEPGESLTAAAIRETHEETGYSFNPDALLGLYLWNCADADTTFLRVAFCGNAAAPETQPILDEGILATHWLTHSQIIAQRMHLRSPLVLNCIQDFQAGTRHPLNVITELPLEQLARLATIRR